MTGKLKINGKETEFSPDMPETVAELLKRLDIESMAAAVDVDGKIVGRGDFVSTTIASGQSIEIVRFVGGG